jgi:hypothetical protein
MRLLPGGIDLRRVDKRVSGGAVGMKVDEKGYLEVVGSVLANE